MNKIIEDLFYEWSTPYDQRDALLPHMNGYRETRQAWEEAERALRAVLGEEEKRLFGRYTDAALAYFTMGETASLIAGMSTALRLFLSLLIP